MVGGVVLGPSPLRCGGEAADGQVLAVVPAGTAAEARRDGPRKCERLTRAVREKLADVRGFAVIPSPDTFQPAGRRTACLVLGADGSRDCFAPATHKAGSWSSQGPWTSGTHYAVCTVRRADGGTMEPTTRR
ncbi:MAG: hypothetical protein HOY69_33810 [Streptomyces sp.]|nr:hypothetical protein [Streptomyces sp.]